PPVGSVEATADCWAKATHSVVVGHAAGDTYDCVTGSAVVAHDGEASVGLVEVSALAPAKATQSEVLAHATEATPPSGCAVHVAAPPAGSVVVRTAPPENDDATAAQKPLLGQVRPLTFSPATPGSGASGVQVGVASPGFCVVTTLPVDVVTTHKVVDGHATL